LKSVDVGFEDDGNDERVDTWVRIFM
jgi:hypothetical protein